jgi:hypothetical protein
MQSADYYRETAAKARRLSATITPSETSELLQKLARDYDDIAVDLERGAIEIVHPSRLPQRNHAE